MENPYDDDYATREHVYRYSFTEARPSPPPPPPPPQAHSPNVTKLAIPFGWQPRYVMAA